MIDETSKSNTPHPYHPRYGDLTTLNTECTILNTIGQEKLAIIVGDFMDQLQTSASVYERNGDYALGIFSSSWCRRLDESSRNLCNTSDNSTALASGKWLCHESCWQTAKQSMETRSPVDLICNGGLHIYAVPITIEDEVIGSVNFAYGAPPTDEDSLREIELRYRVPASDLRALAQDHPVLDERTIQLAKRRLNTAAMLIANLVGLSRSRKRLRENEERFHSLFENAPLGYQSLNLDGTFLEVNQAWLSTLGYQRADVIGKWFGDFLLPHQVPAFRERFPNFIKNKKVCTEFEMRHRDGTIRHIAFDGRIGSDEQGNFKQTHCILRDVTDQRHLANAMRQEMQTTNDIIAAIPSGLLIYQFEEPDVLILERTNPAGEKIIGGQGSDLIGRDFSELWPNARADGIVTKFLEVIRTGVDVRHEEITYSDRRVTGVFRVHAFNIPGRKLGVAFEDITAIKQAEAALRNSDEAHRTLVNALPDIVMRFDQGCCHTFVSENIADVMDLSPADMIGKTHFELGFPTEMCRTWQDTIRGVFATGMASESEIHFDGKKGLTIFNWRLLPEFNSAGEIHSVLSISRDVTEMRKMQEEMQKQQKLESLALLAGGIAHDFNNLLMGIYGYIELANEAATESTVHACLGKTMLTIERARGLTQQLLTFAKGGVPIREVGSLFPLIEQTVLFSLSGTSITRIVNLVKSLAARDFPIPQGVMRPCQRTGGEKSPPT